MSISNPTYMMCSYSDVDKLMERAKKESEEILSDFHTFFKPAGVVSIELYPIDHSYCYSIGGKFTWNGETLIKESDCALLFLQLNDLIINHMLQSGYMSHLKGSETT